MAAKNDGYENNLRENRVRFSLDEQAIRRKYEEKSCAALPKMDVDVIYSAKQREILSSLNVMEKVRRLSGQLCNSSDRKTTESKLRKKISESEIAMELHSPSLVELDGQESTENEESRNELRFRQMEKRLVWVRRQLLALKAEDEVLAQKFMSLRLDIQRLRFHQMSEDHQIALENAAFDVTERRELSLSSLCDGPTQLEQEEEEFLFSRLTAIGLIKRDVINRRFSLG